MKKLALFGASGHGKVVAEIALLCGWSTVEFFDDAWPSHHQNGKWPISGNAATLQERLAEFDGVLVSIGDCAIRWKIQEELQMTGARLVTLIHPSAVISPDATLGIGTVVMAGAVINVDTLIGPAGIINTGATVDHDCKLGYAVHICPGTHLSGNVHIGNLSWIGVGATVKQGMRIGERVLVGAGAVVVNSFEDGFTLIGNPARPR